MSSTALAALIACVVGRGLVENRCGSSISWITRRSAPVADEMRRSKRRGEEDDQKGAGTFFQARPSLRIFSAIARFALVVNLCLAQEEKISLTSYAQFTSLGPRSPGGLGCPCFGMLSAHRQQGGWFVSFPSHHDNAIFESENFQGRFLAAPEIRRPLAYKANRSSTQIQQS